MTGERKTGVRFAALVAVLVFVGWAPGSQLVLAGDAPCLQQYDFRAYCPFTEAMDANEPNSPAANGKVPILTPPPSTEPNLVPADLSTWERPVGRWYREAPVCLPVQGWALDSIVFVDGTTIPTVTMSTERMVWGLATDVRQGPNWWAIRATARNVADPTATQTRTVFVVVMGILDDVNAAPILAWLYPLQEVSG